MSIATGLFIVIFAVIAIPLAIAPLVFVAIDFIFYAGTIAPSDYWEWTKYASVEATIFVNTLAYILTAIAAIILLWTIAAMRSRNLRQVAV